MFLTVKFLKEYTNTFVSYMQETSSPILREEQKGFVDGVQRKKYLDIMELK